MTVDMGEWLAAMLPLVGTEWDSMLTPADLRVARALANLQHEVPPSTGPGCTDTGYHCDDCRCEPALTPEQFDESVQELIDAGFLVDVLQFDVDDDHQEHMLEFRIPSL